MKEIVGRAVEDRWIPNDSIIYGLDQGGCNIASLSYYV